MEKDERKFSLIYSLRRRETGEVGSWIPAFVGLTGVAGGGGGDISGQQLDVTELLHYNARYNNATDEV
jgi:hypothetical protein